MWLSMDVRLSQEKTRRNPPLAQTAWEEESLALSLLSASSWVVHSAAFVHQSYVRSELMIFFLRNLCFYYKTQFYKTLLTMQDSLRYSTYRTMLNATNTVLNMVTYKKYNYLQYRLLPLLIILILLILLLNIQLLTIHYMVYWLWGGRSTSQ